MNIKIKLIILPLLVTQLMGCFFKDECVVSNSNLAGSTTNFNAPMITAPDSPLDIWITRAREEQDTNYYDDVMPYPQPTVHLEGQCSIGYASDSSMSDMPMVGISEPDVPPPPSLPAYPDYPGSPPIELHAGILTAGSFNDALNLEAFKAFWISNQSSNQNQLPSFDNIQIESQFSGGPKQTVEIAFVLDTTGSMGDELSYLKKELEYISVSIKTRHPNVKQKFSLIAYRDRTDQYITTGNHFTENLPAFLEFLNSQSARGGGDYPEAMHVPLEEAVAKLSWGDQDTAKVLFLIADAPPHEEYVSATLSAVKDLKEKGVHIYPVAASGVADLSERIMRYSALVTGGEYLFITDDSGVGNTHVEPHIPCYEVSHLNELMILKVSEQIVQAPLRLGADKILRIVGSSSGEGACLQ